MPACSSPNGRSSPSWTGARCASGWPGACSSTGATSSTATSSARPASSTRASAGVKSESRFIGRFSQSETLWAAGSRVVQALILVGGEGTRLRPLTSTVPKPVVQLVDRPFIAFMIEWLRGHGVDDVILACGFMAHGVRDVLGDGSTLGGRRRYTEEPQPLGTGGALKYAEDLLDERFFMLNGDILSDMDLTAQLRQHEETAARATL